MQIGNGQIAEFSNDWDGYAGRIPPDSALVAEVLKDYGYSTGAWGKWHNTPAEETTAAGPFEDWPTGLGFEYFYGFLAGEASQYEPNLVRNTTIVRAAENPRAGLPPVSEDLADDAINWLRNHKALQADKPFFMYWASGCLHGPHHIMKEWADHYAGQFDDGWDAYRERVFERAKQMGWIPPTRSSPRAIRSMPAWDDIPEDETPFQRRLMEVAAGFAEHVDVQVGRMVDEWIGWATPTTRCSSTSGATTDPRPRAKTAPSPNCWPKTAFRPRSTMHIDALERARWAGRAGLTQGGQPVPRRLGMGG